RNCGRRRGRQRLARCPSTKDIDRLLEHLDFVGEDWKFGGFHDGVLCQLLGIIRVRLAPQNQASIQKNQLETSDLPQQSALEMNLKLIHVRDRSAAKVRERESALHGTT